MRELTLEDLSRIVRLESACFIPPVRASEDRIRRRLELGHVMLGVDHGDALIGVISFLYAQFSPNRVDRFPKTHVELSMQPMDREANAGFTYNLAVSPGHRGLSLVRTLLRAAAIRMVEAGCTAIVGSSRMPSYAGSLDYPEENILPSPELRSAVDRHLAGGPLPTLETFHNDPLLAFYQRMTGGTFLWILPDFDPHDVASGGMGVVLHDTAKAMLTHLNSSPER